MAQKTAKKKGTLPRLIIGIVILVALVAVILVVVFRNQLNLDALGRRIGYRSLGRNDAGVTEAFSIDGSATDLYTLLGDDLLVCTQRGVRLYDTAGECLYMDENTILSDPAVEVCGNYAAAYSIGGDSVYLYSAHKQVGDLNQLDGPIMSVRLNSRGWMAILMQDSSYKAIISIYDNNLDLRCSVRLSSSFIVDALVTEDCKYLAAVAIGQDDAAFEGSISLYSLSSNQDTGVYYDLETTSKLILNNNVILDLYNGSTTWLIGDNALNIWKDEKIITWNYEDLHLRDYAISDKQAAMLMGKSQTGTQTQLYLIDSNGNVSDPYFIENQVLSLSAAGRYVGVLSSETLDIYSQDLKPYAELIETNGARQVVMRSDGSVFLIRSGYAQLYIP